MRYLAVAVLIAVPAAVSLRLAAVMAFVLAALYLMRQLGPTPKGDKSAPPKVR